MNNKYENTVYLPSLNLLPRAQVASLVDVLPQVIEELHMSEVVLESDVDSRLPTFDYDK